MIVLRQKVRRTLTGPDDDIAEDIQAGTAHPNGMESDQEAQSEEGSDAVRRLLGYAKNEP